MVKPVRNFAFFVTEARKSKIASVVASRTNSVAILLENIADKGNENAVTRTMDALGFQSLHRVGESGLWPKARGKKQSVRTDEGSRKWITIHNWTSIDACIQHLKEEGGYKIAVAAPNAKIPISELDFCTQKLVLAFGNEARGASERLTQMSDVTFSLPMCGFVQSFNVSVAAALALYHAYTHRVQQLVSQFLVINVNYLINFLHPLMQGSNGDLAEQEKQQLENQFYINNLQTLPD